MAETRASTPTPPPSEASEASGSPEDSEDSPRVPLAWFEIESDIGEFKRVVRVPFYRGQVITIGRHAEACNLRFHSKSVSPIHCEIYSILFDKDANYPPLIYVRDCKSKSGTFVNGDLVGQQPFVTTARLLENNDVISVGPCSLQLCDYVVPEDEAALTPLQQKEASNFADQFLIKDIFLGSGAFASVYLAVNVQTKKQVVCKIYDLSALKEALQKESEVRCDTIVQRVEREMSIWSQLDHPNIVAFHRAFQTSNTMFIFGDLAAGGDLFSLLQREKSIPEFEIKWILLQVLRAVDYLHCKGVAHRDIKPENILCSSSAHLQHRIVLADFGCAGVTSFGRLTSDVGTDIYRAPEADERRKPHGVAVDMWAVGVLILQLMAGDYPVESSENLREEKNIEQFVGERNFERVGQRNGPISQNGIDFILSCLNLQPHARPTAAGAAKHAWLRESAEEVLQFKEREKQLSWKPRDIIIPAIVRLPDISEEPSKVDPRGQDQVESHDQPGSSQVIPDSEQNSQESSSNGQQNTACLERFPSTITGVKRPHSLIACRSTTVL